MTANQDLTPIAHDPFTLYKQSLHPYLPHLSPITNTESVVLPTLFPSITKWLRRYRQTNALCCFRCCETWSFGHPSPITHLSLPISPNTAIKFSLFQGVATEFPISVRPADILCRGPDLFSGYPLVKPACQGQLRRLSDLHPAEDGIYPTSKAARTNSEPPARYGHS